jgi:AraC family transcriptional regulator
LLSSGVNRAEPLSKAITQKMRAGTVGASKDRAIASGDGWRVVDIVCTYGPHDRAFEERFLLTSISLVLSGSFIYRTARGTNLMSAGTLMLGDAGARYECSHQCGEGDRCLSFQFAPDLFERIAADAGAKRTRFNCDRLPPLRQFALLCARASLAANEASAIDAISLEEVALDLVGAVIPIVSDTQARAGMNRAQNAQKIADVLRRMENGFEQRLSIADLARETRLSRYHFLRTFREATGITPHQWLLRTRLRRAAERLAGTRDPITEIALDVGFDDLSNFIRSFRAEFGVSPSRYRTSRRYGKS